MKYKSLSKKSIYNKKRYWYHISTTLKRKQVRLIPWDNYQGFNRAWSEPNDKRICVAPTVAHCLTAVPYCPGNKYEIYRTKTPVKANPPTDIFDAKVTLEGWLQTPTVFVKIGSLRLEDVENGENVYHLITEAASGNQSRLSGKVLAWWKRRNLKKYIKRT